MLPAPAFPMVTMLLEPQLSCAVPLSRYDPTPPVSSPNVSDASNCARPESWMNVPKPALPITDRELPCVPRATLSPPSFVNVYVPRPSDPTPSSRPPLLRVPDERELNPPLLRIAPLPLVPTCSRNVLTPLPLARVKKFVPMPVVLLT